MHRLFAVFLAASCVAWADSLHDRINQANGLLRSGDTEKALDAYHQIQVDYPDTRVLDYNIGCAEYEQAMKAAQAQDQEKAKAGLTDAIDAFNRAMQGDSTTVNTSSAFNRANCLAQTAKNGDKSLGVQEKTQAYQEAIKAYEDVLKANPQHEGALQNIDNLRYTLKKELATPPPPPQQGKGDSDPQDQQQQDQQQKDQSSPQNQQENSQKEENQQQDQQDQQNKQQDSQNTGDNAQSDSPEDQPEQQQNEPSSEKPADAQQEKPEQQTGADNPPPDHQTTEALLQALENTDKVIQKNVRKGPKDARVRETDWW